MIIIIMMKLPSSTPSRLPSVRRPNHWHQGFPEINWLKDRKIHNHLSTKVERGDK